MKKILILLTFFVSNIVYGQDFISNLGVNAGINYSKLFSNKFVQTERKCGFFVGGTYNIEFGENLFLIPGLTYNSKRTYLLIDNITVVDEKGHEIGTGDSKSNLIENSLMLPVLIQFDFLKRVYAIAGPHFGYILSRKYIIIEHPYESINQTTTKEKVEEPFDYGLSIGLGFKITQNISFSINHYWGLKAQGISKKPTVFNSGIIYNF